jgi:hypothetical protein
VLERVGLVVRDVRGREHCLKLDARRSSRRPTGSTTIECLERALDALEGLVAHTRPQENTTRVQV